MSFDVFGDFETRGYLRNTYRAKDPETLKRIERAAFSTNVERAMARLEQYRTISITAVDEVHKNLFATVYPWAGQQREQLVSLRALTAEMKLPGKGHLDTYLRPFIKPAISRDWRIEQLLNLKGLGPTSVTDNQTGHGQGKKPSRASDS